MVFPVRIFRKGDFRNAKRGKRVKLYVVKDEIDIWKRMSGCRMKKLGFDGIHSNKLFSAPVKDEGKVRGQPCKRISPGFGEFLFCGLIGG